MLTKPNWIFDRVTEWDRLSQFLDGPRGTRLAVVYGRRRQGKTALTQAWCEAVGGFHWEAAEVEAAQNLESLGVAWSAWTGSPGGLRFASWDDAIRQLCSAGATRGASNPVPVVLDEVSRVIASVPELPSLIQRALGPATPAYRGGLTRLVLCGSAFGAMRRLLDGPAALRGRASLELVIEPFDFRTAADFWGLASNPRAAFELHALVGGTPAYVDLAHEDRPRNGNVDAWVIRRLLDPSSALHREGRIVVAEDSALTSRQMYWGLLAALADGTRRWSDLERVLGGKRGSLKHELDVTIEAGWVVRREDPLRAQRATYALTEPMIRFQRLVVEPNTTRISSRGRADLIWNDARPDVAARIYGPHLETLALDWIVRFANPESVGGVPYSVGPTTLDNGSIQLDVAATERTSSGGTRVILVGEVTATSDRVGVDQVKRLDLAVQQLGDGADVKRMLFSKAGFTAELVRLAARRPDVELVDLARLYDGA